MTYETHTWREIQSQPQVWPHVLDVVQTNAAALRALFADRPFDTVVVTGCGSTYYLALAAAALPQTLTRVAARAPRAVRSRAPLARSTWRLRRWPRCGPAALICWTSWRCCRLRHRRSWRTRWRWRSGWRAPPSSSESFSLAPARAMAWRAS